jgi:IS30 family transposase
MPRTSWKHPASVEGRNLVSVSELAKSLGIHRDTIYKAVRRGRIQPDPEALAARPKRVLFDLEMIRRSVAAGPRPELVDRLPA